VGVLALGASTASAGEVRWFGGCWHQGSGGTATTTPGPLTVSFGWATNSVPRTQKFLEYQFVTYSVDDGPSTVTSAGWGPITQGTNPETGQVYYSTRWTSPVLANLSSGQSVTVHVSLKVTKTVWDDEKTSYKADTELLHNPDYPTLDLTTCTITAQ
jgi:hypothetical protein